MATGRTPDGDDVVGVEAAVVAGQHLLLLLEGRVADLELEQEAVELGLGQRVGALVLDRVLGGDHDERIGQRVGAPSMETWRSSIDSSSAAWVFGGVRLISSASSRLVNTGPSRKRNVPSRGSKMTWPMTSDGMRSGVNCTRLKSRSRAAASALTSSVLAVPGTPSSSTWPSHEQRGDQARERALLADDDLAHLVAQREDRPSRIAGRLGRERGLLRGQCHGGPPCGCGRCLGRGRAARPRCEQGCR